MKILVTGSAGMVGHNLINALHRAGHEVYGISRRRINLAVKQYTFNLMDKEMAKKVIEEIKPDVVYHCAANAAESRGQISPIDMTERNLNIFLHTLVPSINVGVKRFIYLSSVAVYGDCLAPYDENDTPLPKDIYGINKYACEQILKVLAKVHKFNYTIFRPHNIYGPHQDMSNPYKNVVALFMRNIKEDKEITLYGEGKMKRGFSFVEDVVDVLVRSLDDKFINKTLNLGSIHDSEIIELLQEIEKIAGKKAKVKMLPARPQEIFVFLAKREFLTELCNYRETPLAVGLKKTWDFINLPPIEVEPNEIYVHTKG